MMSAKNQTDQRIQAFEAGAEDILASPPNKRELLARTKSLIHLKRLNGNLTNMENVLYSLANAIEAKDAYTQGHVERVSGLAVAIGRKLKLGPKDLEALKLGGILHDIGKIAVPSQILNKPGPLNEDEWQIMKDHTAKGHQICLPLRKNLGAALSVIRHHHERLDGSGYPDGLSAAEIPTVARIMAVVDYYDALISDRPYHRKMTCEKAFSILGEEVKKRRLDGAIIDCLFGIVRQ
jgi:putative two-component system response regulator